MYVLDVEFAVFDLTLYTYLYTASTNNFLSTHVELHAWLPSLWFHYGAGIG